MKLNFQSPFLPQSVHLHHLPSLITQNPLCWPQFLHPLFPIKPPSSKTISHLPSSWPPNFRDFNQTSTIPHYGPAIIFHPFCPLSPVFPPVGNYLSPTPVHPIPHDTPPPNPFLSPNFTSLPNVSTCPPPTTITTHHLHSSHFCCPSGITTYGHSCSSRDIFHDFDGTSDFFISEFEAIGHSECWLHTLLPSCLLPHLKHLLKSGIWQVNHPFVLWLGQNCNMNYFIFFDLDFQINLGFCSFPMSRVEMNLFGLVFVLCKNYVFAMIPPCSVPISSPSFVRVFFLNYVR